MAANSRQRLPLGLLHPSLWQMGLIYWFCNLSPIVTVCMQAQTHGSLQQAEIASWIITTISMADGACALVLQLKPHCVTVCMQAQTHGSLQQAEIASWVITPISMADGAYLLVSQLKPHCHCMHASTNPWQLTASRDCLLGNYNHLYGRWGLCIGYAT